MVANTLKALALVIQLALNVLALSLVVAWPYNIFRRAGWPQIDDNTFLIGAVLAVVALGMIPVLFPGLAPDRDRFGRALLLTGWPLMVMQHWMRGVQRLPLIGIIGDLVLIGIQIIQSVALALASVAVKIEMKSPRS